MSFNIVLVHPQIPNNTGNIGRLCVATNCNLHLVEPLGFELTDKYLKRAGLDYWQHVRLTIHKSYSAFEQSLNEEARLFFTSAKASKSVWQVNFQKNDYLVFGREADGLPVNIVEKVNQLIQIPLYSKQIRSLNLANAVSVIVYEGLRQLNAPQNG